jgi:hypothetical protein
MIECPKCESENDPKRIFCSCGFQLRLRTEEELAKAPEAFIVDVDERGVVTRRKKR